MDQDTPLERLARTLTVPITAVRMNAARPSPPAGRRIAAIGEIRLIVPLEGVKEEIFGDGQEVQHWRMVPGDALVVRADTWLCPLFHSRNAHFGLIAAPDRLRLGWGRCDGRGSARTEQSAMLDSPEGSSLRRSLQALAAVESREAIASAGPWLLTGILHLLHQDLSQPVSPAGRSELTWTEVVTYVHDRYDTPIGRDAVASALGLSPGYLSRLCRRRAGKPFIDFLNGVRLDHAARMLRHSQCPITEVASACGFNDAGYFIRRFRREFGATPAAWRRARVA